MYDIDTSQAFLLIEARSQLAREAFELPANAGCLALPKQIRQPTNVAPSGTFSEIALQLRLDEKPVNPGAGHIFGSSEEDCDVLLDTSSNRGVSSMASSIVQDRESRAIVLTCLARKGVFLGKDTQDGKPQHLRPGKQVLFEPGHTCIVILGSVHIALTPIQRVRAEQQLYDRNFKNYIGTSGSLVTVIDKLEQLKTNSSAHTSTEDTPATGLLTGLWGEYTTAGIVGKGGQGSITACISKTGITCCAKESKAGIGGKQLKEEIRCLRKVAHPSIVQYIDRDRNFTWVAMELAKEGDLEQQHHIQKFTMRETEVLIYQALDALSHVHSCGIIHHDIKLTNILVQIRTENRILVKLADFGQSVRASKHPSAPRGSPRFLAPECFKNPPASWGMEIDVWALAIVALRLSFGLPRTPAKIPGTSDYGPESPYAKQNQLLAQFCYQWRGRWLS